MRKKIVKKPLESIKESFVVRIELNRERVEHLKDLISTGVELDPILVSEDDGELIDGRHRKAAYLELGIQDVRCEVRKFGSLPEKITEALRCNVGGALPPTHADINHTMQILLIAGQTRKLIIKMVSENIGFPPKLVANHLDEVQSNMAKSRLKKAASAVVNDGKTVHEAAFEEGVKLETLKKFLEVEDKTGDSGAASVNQVKAHLGMQFRKLQHIQGHALAKVLRELKDGLITAKQSSDVIEYVNTLTAKVNRYHDEWVSRFASHIGTAVEGAEVSKVKVRKSQVSLGNKTLGRMGVTQ